MAPAYKHEEIATVPRGYKVRTVRRGQHEIRLAFPPGRRQKGSGVLVEILHPTGENPACRIANLLNPTKLELQRTTRERAKRIRAARQKNPHMQVSFDPGVKKFLAFMYDAKFGNLYATGFTKKQAAQALREVWRKARATGSWRNPKEGKNTSRTYEAAGKSFKSRAKAERYAKSIEKTSGIRVPVYETTGANPDEGELREAERLYEEFHGRAPREILAMQETSEARGEYTALGELVELTMIAPTGDHVQIKFKEDGVRVASSPNGEQLYLLGGNQDITGSLGMFGADDEKDLIDLGEAKQIVYEAAKWQTDFTAQEWKHNFGEESGVRPRGFYDQLKKRIFFAGGTYQVKRPGIID